MRPTRPAPWFDGIPASPTCWRLLCRCAAAGMLCLLFSVGCSPAYLRGLAAERRAAAAEATGNCSPPAYLYDLSSDDPRTRATVLESLERHNTLPMSSCYAPPMVVALESNDRDVRLMAMALLEDTRGRCEANDHDPRCYRRLFPAFHAVVERLAERDTTVREAALEFLRGFPREMIPELYDDRMREALIVVFRDKRPHVAGSAFELISRSLDESLYPMYVEYTTQDLDGLGRHGASALGSFPMERRAALMKPHLPALHAVLDEPDHPTKRYIVRAFTRVGGTDAAHLLIPLLGHDDILVRREAVDGLVDLDREVVAPLLSPEAINDLRLLADDEKGYIASYAVALLRAAGAID